jgi:hypothetical protein
MAKRGSLDTFARQYMETALWSSNDESTPSGGAPLDKNYTVADIAPATRRRMQADCRAFQKRARQALDDAGMSASDGGHDFWLTRNRHGTGFWDRGDGPAFKRLTDIAHSFGEYNLYVGDDGKVHGS